MKLIVVLLLLVYLCIGKSQRCPDYEDDSLHEWSFYLSTKHNDGLTTDKKVIYYFHSGSDQVKTYPLSRNFFIDYLTKIKVETHQHYVYSDSENSNKAHHKSIISLTKVDDETVGTLISHSFPNLHDYFVRGNVDSISLTESQHFFCMTLHSSEDVTTLRNIYSTIKPHLIQVIPDNPKTKSLFKDSPYDRVADPDCANERGTRLTNDIKNEKNLIAVTEELMRPNIKDVHCLKRFDIGIFNFYAVPLMPKPKQPLEEGTKISVREFEVDAWWMVARNMDQKLMVVSHKDKGSLASVTAGDVSVTNFIWDYGITKENGDATHEKLAISILNPVVCLGDGNRHYTQNARAGFYFCFTESVLHQFLFAKPKLLFKEAQPLLYGMPTEDYRDWLKTLPSANQVLVDSKRKFIFDGKTRKEKLVRPLIEWDDTNIEFYQTIIQHKKILEEDGRMDSLMDIYANPKKKKKPTPKEQTMSPSRLYCIFTQSCLPNKKVLGSDGSNAKTNKNHKVAMRCKGCGRSKSIAQQFFTLDKKYGNKSGIEATKIILAYLHYFSDIKLSNEVNNQNNDNIQNIDIDD
ncbi:hypothetical protein DLAC_00107 [Tieghemostelium lacteum]|uniref:Uncharacterized protein n=1 Tax=Tieghemostelium lacteum TaxID=361077 RepID=A0A152A8V5_TIELA|nr:hypothetical protein DLAC_00107 [Tieghemostelium lacteum]|eukprot:KYR02653.1 hypothetical protein DLAC_00107 [Tieghemostelium lacteum]